MLTNASPDLKRKVQEFLAGSIYESILGYSLKARQRMQESWTPLAKPGDAGWSSVADALEYTIGPDGSVSDVRPVEGYPTNDLFRRKMIAHFEANIPRCAEWYPSGFDIPITLKISYNQLAVASIDGPITPHQFSSYWNGTFLRQLRSTMMKNKKIYAKLPDSQGWMLVGTILRRNALARYQVIQARKFAEGLKSECLEFLAAYESESFPFAPDFASTVHQFFEIEGGISESSLNGSFRSITTIGMLYDKNLNEAW